MIKLYSTLFGRMTGLIGDRAYIRTLYFLSFGKLPNLEQPKTFNEHICAIKLSEEALTYSKYADKYQVRAYVAQRLGENYLIPMLGIYDSFDSIPLSDFPNRFVLKATHASGFNALVQDKSKMDVPALRKKFRKWLATDYYTVGREKNYQNITPRILAESYLDFGSELKEYKLFCVNGMVRMISVNCFGKSGRTATVFDRKWNRLAVKMGYPTQEGLQKPQKLQELLRCAEVLSQPFPFVRVDLYEHDGKVLFSELTFTPGGGLQHIEPKSFDEVMGSWL